MSHVVKRISDSDSAYLRIFNYRFSWYGVANQQKVGRGSWVETAMMLYRPPAIPTAPPRQFKLRKYIFSEITCAGITYYIFLVDLSKYGHTKS